MRDTELAGAKRRALVAGGAGSRLSFYVQLPAGAHLAVGYGAAAAGGTALIRVAVDGAPARTLHEGPVGAGWNDVVVDLGAAAGRAARIDLIGRGTKGELAWGDPRIVVKAPAAAAAPATPPKFEHVFVWMVDTLRADKLKAYNPKSRVSTPAYDAFAADATRFAWAQVPGTWSLPSHASILTGVYPSVHRATAHEAKLSPTAPFVAEELKKAGFKTAMFSSNGYISSKWGFDRGWEVNRNFIRESLPNGSEYLWKTAKAWVTPGLAKKQFAYLATIEPHVAYSPKKEFLVKYWDKVYSGPIKQNLSGVQLGLIKAGKLKVTDNDKKYLEALHDAEITQSDAAFATFIADLKAMGIYDKSAVIVVSDHGDQFYEHGSVGHGDTVYQELVHVPLIIRAPGAFPAGHVVQRRRRGDGRLRDRAGPGRREARRQRAGRQPGSAGARRGGRQPAGGADPRRPDRARPEGGPLPPGPPRPGPHGALRRAGGSARTEGRRRRTAHRPALDARRARVALRVRDVVVEVQVGHGRQRQRSVLRGGRPARAPRRRAQIGRPEVVSSGR